MAPFPDEEVIALAPKNFFLESTWSVGSSATGTIKNIDSFIKTVQN